MPSKHYATEGFPSKTVDYLVIFDAPQHKQTQYDEYYYQMVAESAQGSNKLRGCLGPPKPICGPL